MEALHLLGDAAIPTVAMMRVEGSALRIPFPELRREFQVSEPLRCAVLHQVQEQGLLLNQLATCNYFHEVDARLARCLLMLADRLKRSQFHLTQEFLAEMIGVHRPTLTLAAGKLQRNGLIRYSRGHIEICSRPGLTQIACECYESISELATCRNGAAKGMLNGNGGPAPAPGVTAKA